MPGSISVDPGAGVDAAVAGESFQCDGKEPSRPVEPSSEDHNCEANDLVQKQDPVVRHACEDFSEMAFENTGGVDVSPLNGHEVSVKLEEDMGEGCVARQVLDKRHHQGGDGACKKTVLVSPVWAPILPSSGSTLSFPGALGLGKISHMLDLPVFG
ncbi:hypothetical protein U1Q18_043613 [Sarracenia purpurea var. burkii]